MLWVSALNLLLWQSSTGIRQIHNRLFISQDAHGPGYYARTDKANSNTDRENM